MLCGVMKITICNKKEKRNSELAKNNICNKKGEEAQN